MANSILVSQNSSTLSRLSQNSSRQSKTRDTPVPKITETPVITETPPDSFQIIRQSFENQGLSKPVVDIILHSWRDSTKKQYWTYIQRWMRFCTEKHADPMSSSINLILDFLATLFNSGIGYSGINTARSALSSFLMLNGQVSVGNNTLVKRFMRGIFLLKPSLPRYNFTWDVSIFLHYLQTLINDSLTLKQMTLKLCALLSLLTAQRLQSIHLIDKRNILFSNSVVKIRIGDLAK